MARRALPATATSPTTTASRSMPAGTRSRLRSRTRAHQRRRGAATRAFTTPSPQPVPRSDGQAGHFEQTGGVEHRRRATPVGVGDGWYSYNVGSWHLISLNIECETQPGGCSTSTGTWFAAETEWLKKDLAENHSACTARLLAPAHVQRCRQPHRRGHHRWNLVATALRRRSRPGAERTRPPLCSLRPD